MSKIAFRSDIIALISLVFSSLMRNVKEKNEEGDEPMKENPALVDDRAVARCDMPNYF